LLSADLSASHAEWRAVIHERLEHPAAGAVQFEDRLRDLDHDHEPFLDRGGNANGHLRRGVAVPRTNAAPALELPAAAPLVAQQLRRSLTWDHGREMAEHIQFTIDSGVQVYFCDPRSPWQRGSNENTNGLLRQYLPKSADLRQFDQATLDAIAAERNGRPRQTLGFKTPSQAFVEALR
jgi:hypothetical protein